MTDKCINCGYPREEHSYNGACYGLCGEFQSEDSLNLAVLMINEITAALNRGTKHFNKAGRELTTVQEVLECLAQEGEIHFQSLRDLLGAPGKGSRR